MGGTKIPLIPAPFKTLEVAHLCNIKETFLKGRSIGFSEVPQHGKTLTGPWKQNQKGWIEKQYPKNWSDKIVKLLTRSSWEKNFRGDGIRTKK